MFAHGSGSSRHSPRNQYVAQVLNNAGLATLLTDLLTREEEEVDIKTRQHRFNIDLLSERLVAVTDWIIQNPDTQKLFVGYFGASTGAAAALVAAAERGNIISAIVSRGGPDLAWSQDLRNVQAPTLFIVGEKDVQVIEMNENAMKQLDRVERKKLKIVPGATHLFEEPGTLEEVARVATRVVSVLFSYQETQSKMSNDARLVSRSTYRLNNDKSATLCTTVQLYSSCYRSMGN